MEPKLYESGDSDQVRLDPSWQFPRFTSLEFGPKRSATCLVLFVLNENRRLHSQLSKMRQQGVMDSLDVVIADGGSTDGSVEGDIMSGFAVRAILRKEGPGKLGAQMRMAFAWALAQGYQSVVTVDGNDKDDVAAGIPHFLTALSEGFDHVQGSRYIPGGKHANTPFLRHLGVKILHAPLISCASGFRYTDTTNGFRAYSARLLTDHRTAIFRDELSGYELHYYISIRAAKLGFRVKEVPVTRVYPAEGATPTKISPFKGNAHILRILFAACLGAFDPREAGERSPESRSSSTNG